MPYLHTLHAINLWNKNVHDIAMAISTDRVKSEIKVWSLKIEGRLN